MEGGGHVFVKGQTCGEGSGGAAPWRPASLAPTFSPPDPQQRGQYGRRGQDPPPLAPPLELRIKARKAGRNFAVGTFSEAGKGSLEPLSRVSQPKSSSLDVQFKVSEDGGGRGGQGGGRVLMKQ